nr:DUF3300 domain-containing protein [Rhodospirillales bacterium]
MRRARSPIVLAALLGAALAPSPGSAQPAPAAPDLFAIEQLDALLAPIALYPDAVLAPLLMAASDPLQVVQAARWVAQPEHASLTGDALTDALVGQDWDPDVKALAPFPGLLRLLDENLAWTMQLGYAVTDQTDAVLDSVRRLRRQALATGALADGGPFVVGRTGAAVTIAPADAAAVALPAYDPTAAYGAWPYSSVAPVRLGSVPTGTVAVPQALRGLAGIAWGSFEVVLNVKNWNAVNGDRPPVTLSVWHPHPVYAVTGRTDVSLGALPLPPAGPVGRPAPPSGIPANAIGRTTVAVAAELVRHAAARRSAAMTALPPAAAHAGTTGARPVALRLAPLPAHVETVRASALADIGAGAQAAQ